MLTVEPAMAESVASLAQYLLALDGNPSHPSSLIGAEILIQGERRAQQTSELRDLGGTASFLASIASFFR